MKLKKIIISIIVIFSIVSIHCTSSAKYIIECTNDAAIIIINN